MYTPTVFMYYILNIIMSFLKKLFYFFQWFKVYLYVYKDKNTKHSLENCAEIHCMKFVRLEIVLNSKIKIEHENSMNSNWKSTKLKKKLLGLIFKRVQLVWFNYLILKIIQKIRKYLYCKKNYNDNNFMHIWCTVHAA